MIFTYDYTLVLLSVAVAIISAYAGLLLLNSQGTGGSLTYKARIGFAAFVIGTGIWSMHFIGMLALHLPIPIDYAVFQTLLSVLIAITLTGVGLFAATSGHLGPYGWAAGATLMGAGIAAMHYVGMEAIKLACVVTYSTWGTIVSVLLGIAASGLALKIIERGQMSPRTTVYASVVLGCAISVMHYSGMLSTQFAFEENAVAIAVPALNETYLACLVAVATFVLCEVALVMSLPSARTGAGQETDGSADNTMLGLVGKVSRASSRLQTAGTPLEFENGATDASRTAKVHSAPPHRQLDDAQAASGTCEISPIEVLVDGQKAKVSLDRVLFIAADGHYTQIGIVESDGTFATRFSNSSITQTAEQVGERTFARVHRSYLVNLDHVQECRRQGGNGQVSFRVAKAPPIPVSRSRYQSVTDRVASRLRA